MSRFSKGMRVRVLQWQQARTHNHWTPGYRQLPAEGVVESVAYSAAEEREVITVAFDHRVRLPMRPDELTPMTEDA